MPSNDPSEEDLALDDELDEHGFDPKLEALPAPPKTRRALAIGVMSFTVLASLALAASLRADVEYFFASSDATELGDVGTVDAAALEANTYVRVTGTPMASGMLRYSRLLGGSTYSVFPLAGQRTVFVQLTVDGPEAERMLARREFAGRLVTFGELGSRFSPVRRYLDDTMDMPVSGESYLLLADEPPGSYGWALGLFALCLLFVGVDVWLLVRWFRPLPMEAGAGAFAEGRR